MSERTSLLLSSFLEWLNIPAQAQKRFLLQLGAFFAILVIILVIDPTGFTPEVVEGKPAPKTIRSPRTISFVDESKTSELRSVEMEKVQAVFTPIDQAEETMLGKFDLQLIELSNFFEEFRRLSATEPPQSLIASYFPAEALLDEEKLVQLRNLRISQFEKLKNVSRQLLANISQKVITAQNIDAVKAEVRNHVDSYPESTLFKQIMTAMLRNAITINAIEDEKLTRQRREAAARAIQPVKRTFQKGQKIVEEGIIVTSDDYFVMRKIASQLQKNRVLSLLGNVLLAMLAVVISLVFLRLEDKNVLSDGEQYKLLGVICLVTLALAKTAHALGVAFDKQYLSILLTPLPTVALLMTMLLDCTVALFHIFLLGMLMFVVAESNIRFVVVSLFGAIAGILAWRAATRGSDVRNLIGSAGIKTGLASAIAVLAFLLLDTESFATMDIKQIALYAGFGLLNGILSGIVSNGVLPYMESMFSLATSSRLLELTDLSQPLLRKLAEEAPGTYQHSIAVATLAEAAANSVNADPLLTKISAYFHDIGKIRRPMYFAENQADENRHDQVTPYMSSLILIGHIRDSLDLGREYGLPERVLSIMSQHHGTTLISYFYEEAKKLKDGEEVNQERFRYPGPKPQTKEAAVLMLADSVEAAARTLPQHTHGKIEGLVQKIIAHKLNDENQLDESDLTLKDIEKIEQVFVRTLTSMYHSRVDYPGKLSNQAKETTDGSSNQ
ncbi:MAG: HDIG domain-containing protein [Candidatus Riflebacteria bacterium]|nr:HDIG domain-containing protein [Candidatus Riflebacteria bacterium]